MTTDEKLENFYNHSIESAKNEAERIVTEYQAALDQQFAEHQKRKKEQTEEELAVKCGYWHNFRFNPAAENKFTLDSKAPTADDYQAFLDGEVRYNSLKRSNPEKAARLFAKNEEEAKERYAYLQKLVTLYSKTEE